MAFTGKYDFKGISRIGATALRVALSSSPYTAWFFKVPGSQFICEMIVNWFANKGLLLFNIGAIYVNGELDQNALDKAIESGLKQVEIPGVNLTPEQIKELDDAVIKAANRALPYGASIK